MRFIRTARIIFSDRSIIALIGAIATQRTPGPERFICDSVNSGALVKYGGVRSVSGLEESEDERGSLDGVEEVPGGLIRYGEIPNICRRSERRAQF